MNMRCRPFPSRDDVERRVAAFAALSDQERRKAVRDLLEAVSDSQNEKEHEVAYQAMLVLAADYGKRHDRVIVDVFDAFDFGNGGDAITACSFYHGLLGVPEARERYGVGAIGRRDLEGCVGITISKEELAKFDGVNPP
jgi:hypothetical protein